MKKIVLLIGLILSLVSKSQTVSEITNILNTKPQSISVSDVSANATNLFSVDLTTTGYRAVQITITGTWVGIVTFQASYNGSAFEAIPAYQTTTGTWSLNTSSNGTFLIPSYNYAAIRARTTAYSSGTITGVALGQLSSAKIPDYNAGSLTNVAQLNGNTVNTGNGTAGTGTQRVAISSDQTAFGVNANQSGTWTVQPGNTANTTPWLVTDRPATSGGYDVFKLVTAASTNATNIKASAGQVYGWYIFNANASARKVMFHNTSGTPTAGASTFFSLVIPGGSAANVSFPAGVAFSSGIAITTVTGTADNDATAVAAGDLIISIFYK